jgi:hypothetical protein
MKEGKSEQGPYNKLKQGEKVGSENSIGIDIAQIK